MYKKGSSILLGIMTDEYEEITWEAQSTFNFAWIFSKKNKFIWWSLFHASARLLF